MPRGPSERPAATGAGADKGAAALGAVAGAAALLSAAACCVLPLALAAIGIGFAGLSPVVAYHWPLTIAAVVAVAAGWILQLRRRQACARAAGCSPAPPAKSTVVLLWLATVLVVVSASWSIFEAPLLRALGGA